VKVQFSLCTGFDLSRLWLLLVCVSLLLYVPVALSQAARTSASPSTPATGSKTRDQRIRSEQWFLRGRTCRRGLLLLSATGLSSKNCA